MRYNEKDYYTYEELQESREEKEKEANTNKEKRKTKLKKGIFAFITFLLGLFVFENALVITMPNEYRIIKQFGKIVNITEKEGASFKIPILQSSSSIPKNIMLYDLPQSDVITSDKKTMITNCYVLWEITDAKKFVKSLNGSIGNAENRIDTIVYNAIKNTISGMTQEEVIQSRDEKIVVANNNSELENAELDIDIETELETVENSEETATTNKEEVEVINLTKEIMGNFNDVEEEYGIKILTVDQKVLDLPEENKAAVYERTIAERNNVAAQYTAQGESEAQIIRNAADKEASILLSEAEASANRLIAEGEAEYMKILSDVYNDESKADFYLFVRSLDALKSSMTGTNKTIILDESSPIAEIFNNLN